jgi:hypothetical protein
MQDRALQCEAFSGADLGDGLKTVKLAGWGRTESTNGDFIIDDEGVREILRTFSERAESLPVDVEHESLADRKPATGSRGAVGWLEKLWGSEAEKGLFALVRWSDTGKALIRSDAFRYLSPVFVIRKDDRKVVAVHSAAITTLPAIGKMDRLAASQNASAETTAMADENAAIAASVRERLGLPATANRDAVLLAMTVVGADDKAATELAAMRQAESQRTATAMVQGFIAAGKLNPNDRGAVEAATRLALSDPGTLEAIFKNMVPQCPPGRTNPPTSRQTVIAMASRDYDSNVGHQKATSLLAFVANSLREGGFSKLTERETAELSIV